MWLSITQLGVPADRACSLAWSRLVRSVNDRAPLNQFLILAVVGGS
jgi:hypothetical protein